MFTGFVNEAPNIAHRPGFYGLHRDTRIDVNWAYWQIVVLKNDLCLVADLRAMTAQVDYDYRRGVHGARYLDGSAYRLNIERGRRARY